MGTGGGDDDDDAGGGGGCCVVGGCTWYTKTGGLAGRCCRPASASLLLLLLLGGHLQRELVAPGTLGLEEGVLRVAADLDVQVLARLVISRPPKHDRLSVHSPHQTARACTS